VKILTADGYAAIAVSSAEATPVRQEYRVFKVFKAYRVLRVYPVFRVRQEQQGQPGQQDRKAFRV
jgi:predicted CoA-binding protein